MEEGRDLKNSNYLGWTTPAGGWSITQNSERSTKGLSVVTTPKGIVHLCREFPRIARFEVYDSNFTSSTSFPRFPRSQQLCTFGIQAIGQKITETYAQKGDDKRHEEVKGRWTWIRGGSRPHGGFHTGLGDARSVGIPLGGCAGS